MEFGFSSFWTLSRVNDILHNNFNPELKSVHLITKCDTKFRRRRLQQAESDPLPRTVLFAHFNRALECDVQATVGDTLKCAMKMRASILNNFCNVFPSGMTLLVQAEISLFSFTKRPYLWQSSSCLKLPSLFKLSKVD
jgi:hypothetical protein